MQTQFVKGLARPLPGAHLPGAKALAGSFTMSGFAGYSAPGESGGLVFVNSSSQISIHKAKVEL